MPVDNRGIDPPGYLPLATKIMIYSAFLGAFAVLLNHVGLEITKILYPML